MTTSGEGVLSARLRREWVAAQLRSQTVQVHHVLRGHVRLDVVGGCHDVAPSGPQGSQPGLQLLLHVLHAARQRALGVDRSVEAETAAELLLDAGRIHAGGQWLQRIEDVHSDLDQVGNDGPDGATAVEHDLGTRRQRLDVANDLGIEGFNISRYVAGDITRLRCVP